MKLKNISAVLILSACIFVSCQTELDENKRFGYVQLSSVSLDKSVTSRSGNEIMSVKITGADGKVFKEADDWTQLQGESFLVPAGGEYTVEAYSANKTLSEGFDAQPYYKGSETFTVKANTSHTVDVECKLAQSLVKVSYSDDFKSHFSDYSAVVIGSAGTNINFGGDENREAYVKVGQSLSVKLALTPNGGQPTEFERIVTENALAAYRYNVNFDVNTDGNGNITVSVDINRNEYEVTLGVPLKPDGVSTVAVAGDPSKVWGKFAYISGLCTLVDPSDPIEFKYKKTDDPDWLTITAQKVEGTDYEYNAKLTSLDFGTEYEYKLLCGDKEGEVLTFTTEKFVEIPNLNFDTWNQNGKNWYPNTDASNSFWATGNEGVTTLGDSNSVPVEGEDAFNGKAAKLETVTVSLVGYAAGNLLIGNYKTNMNDMAASVQFGRPYEGARPLVLSGYYKYTPGTSMNKNGKIPSDRTLTVDECDIYIKLWSGEQIIAESHFVTNQTTTEYTKFELPIEYTDKSKYPDKITIVATSSRYGGEFEGSGLLNTKVVGQVSAGSVLYVDEFSLSYE